MGSTGVNLDLLSWFGDDERSRCGACGKNACVGVDPEAATVCLACGAVWLDERRLDRDRHLDG